MKKSIVIAACLGLCLLAAPALGGTIYVIELKNKAKLVADAWWEEGGLIKFSHNGGVMGIDKAKVQRIVKDQVEDRPEPVAEPQEAAGGDGETAPAEAPAAAAQKDEADAAFQAKFETVRRDYADVEVMSSEQLHTFARDLVALRDEVLAAGKGDVYAGEVLEFYNMADHIETILKQRGD